MRGRDREGASPQRPSTRRMAETAEKSSRIGASASGEETRAGVDRNCNHISVTVNF
jgi:hypothetical protein